MRRDLLAGGSPLRRALIEFGLVALLLVLLSVVIRIFDLDLRVARSFYRPGEIPDWWGRERQPWEILYRFGVWPANILGIAALVGWIASLFRSVLRRYQRTFLFLFLVLALGPGVIVNMVLKDHWGRPRPRDLVEFGGSDPFLPVGVPGIPGHGHAFPSGHAAMGFYFTTLYILWRNRRPQAAQISLGCGLAYGGLIGFQRVASGGHFLSDPLWAGGLVYLTGIVVDGWLPRDGPAGRARRRFDRIALVLLGSAIAGAAFLGTPYFAESEDRFGPLTHRTVLAVDWEIPGSSRGHETEIIRGDGAMVTLRIRAIGYGSFDNEVTSVVMTGERADSFLVHIQLLPRGFFIRLRPEISYGIETDEEGPPLTPVPRRPPKR